MDPIDQAIPRLDGLELATVALPLVSPFATSFGVTKTKEALLIRVTSGSDEGWGECIAQPEPCYSYETNQTARHVIRDFLAPMLLKEKQFTMKDIQKKMAAIRGHGMAKAAVENALLDLLAKRQSIPLYRLLGGENKKIPSGISIGIKESREELLEAIGAAGKRGYQRIKIKIKRGVDLDVVRQVRREFPEILLMVDANSDYALEDLPLFKQFDQFHLMMIEQPLAHDDIYFHSLLQRELQTPLCLDESIETLLDVRAAFALKSCRLINIKQGRVGGLLRARDISEYCRQKNLGVWSGGMLETGIGRAVNIHFQGLPAFHLPGDTSETSRYFNEDIVEPPVELDKDGFISMPQGAGIGVTIIPERLNKYLLHREVL